MKMKHPWHWILGSLAVILLLVAAFIYCWLKETLRGDYETIRVVDLVEDYIKTHDGNWPSSWDDLDGTEKAKFYSPLNSSYWRNYTKVDFTLTSDQIIEQPDLIYTAVLPMSGEYYIYPHAKRDISRLIQTIHETKNQHDF
jgi:hypothetical protein